MPVGKAEREGARVVPSQVFVQSGSDVCSAKVGCVLSQLRVGSARIGVRPAGVCPDQGYGFGRMRFGGIAMTLLWTHPRPTA